MKVLLIEDDSNKAAQISAVVPQIVPDAVLQVCRSYQGGLYAAVHGEFDLALFDMTMPNYDVTTREPGGKERRYAGKEIMRQVVRRRKALPIIVITQYEQFEENGVVQTLPELEAALRTEFPANFLGAVFYQAGSIAWVEDLRKLINSSEGTA